MPEAAAADAAHQARVVLAAVSEEAAWLLAGASAEAALSKSVVSTEAAVPHLRNKHVAEDWLQDGGTIGAKPPCAGGVGARVGADKTSEPPCTSGIRGRSATCGKRLVHSFRW